jgi:Ca-activated chloride channel homolog
MKFLFVIVIVLLTLSMIFFSWSNDSFWFSADQSAMKLLQLNEPALASQLFESQEWKGVAHYQAGNFEEAARAFSSTDTPINAFNRGNSLVFLGQYEKAIESYDRATQSRGDWTQAIENRELAYSRRLQQSGGDEGTGGKLGADEIVFDNSEPSDSSDTIEVAENEPIDGAELNALWLRNVRTDPGDFLRLKFAYQHGVRDAIQSQQRSEPSGSNEQ